MFNLEFDEEIIRNLKCKDIVSSKHDQNSENSGNPTRGFIQLYRCEGIVSNKSDI